MERITFALRQGNAGAVTHHEVAAIAAHVFRQVQRIDQVRLVAAEETVRSDLRVEVPWDTIAAEMKLAA